jgi:hypothetical protein
MKETFKEEYLQKSNLHPSDLVFLSDFSKELNIYSIFVFKDNTSKYNMNAPFY